MKNLEGKVAVITGGSSGIGFAAAQRFVQEGAYVYITGRRQTELDEAVKNIGNNITGFQGDVSNPGDLDRLYSSVHQQKGKIDILFANAGIGEILPLDKITEEHFDKTFNVNVKGVLFTVQKALPLFKNGGSIILNGSIAASKGFEGYTVYSATKAAVRSFARTWTLELRSRKIRVNIISPGPIDTPGLNDFIRGMGAEAEQIKSGILSSVPLGRMGTPDEVASAVMFLATEESSYVSGTELFVDGGTAQI